MYLFLAKSGAWLLQKLLVAALIVGLGLAVYGLWIFLREQEYSDARREAVMRELALKREHILVAKAEVQKRLGSLEAGIETQRERVRQAEKIIGALRELESWWDRLWGTDAQQKANAEQVGRLERLKSGALGQVAELHGTLIRARGEKDGLEAALRQTELELATVEASKSKIAHYLQAAWREARWYVVLALAGYFFGPTLWALTLYYGLAALIVRGRPIRFAEAMPALPVVSESRVSLDAVLAPRDVLRIKENFLQSSDEGVTKATRFVLDWRIPFTSLACGLTEMVELRNAGGSGDYHVTLSNAKDPHNELAVVDVPAGSSIVLRPQFLAGVMQGDGGRLEIRRRWQFFRWQAWITGQFRFFEFVGPCRLIVSGSRGVRVERLAGREGNPSPARRTNQDGTIGFTPNLSYQPVRAETFWSYYRGMNPLFDDLFSGEGIFILQETATPGGAEKAGKFWSSVWNGVLKVFGL